MQSRGPADILDVELRHMDAVGLFRVCAADRENSEAWSEFLRRYSGKIKLFIRGTLRQVFGYSADPRDSSAPILYQERDLFQNAIIRLVENDSAVMKKFSGESENELLAYLAVICRSSVLDSLRRNKAYKRRRIAVWEKSQAAPIGSHRPTDRSESERGVLVKELIALARQTIRFHSGDVSSRDQLVFDLHFFDGLSCGQIAQCKGINLSRAGVEKLLKRLVDRVQSLASPGKSEGTPV